MRRLSAVMLCLTLQGCSAEPWSDAPGDRTVVSAVGSDDTASESESQSQPESGPPATITAAGDTLRDYGGFLIGPFGAGWGIRHLERNGRHEIILRRVAGHDADGRARWAAHDTVVATPWGPDDFLVHEVCSRSGVSDSALVAVFAYEDAPILRGAKAAWRLDTLAARLTPLPPAEVECQNEDYGV